LGKYADLESSSSSGDDSDLENDFIVSDQGEKVPATEEDAINFYNPGENEVESEVNGKVEGGDEEFVGV